VSERALARREAVFGAILFVVALVPRAVVALASAGEPVWDGHYYDFGARRIAAGLGYSDDRDVAGALVQFGEGGRSSLDQTGHGRVRGDLR